MSEKVADSLEYNCELCDEAYESETEIPFHIKNCHKYDIQGTDKNICWICLKFFDSNEAVISHIKVCHLYSAPNAKRIEREIFICDHCPQLFLSKALLINHIGFYHMSKDFKWKSKTICHICNAQKSLHKIWHHCRTHTVLSISCCLMCFKKCKNLKDLEVHQEQHPHYLHCEMCGFETRKRSNFIEHIYNHDKITEDNEGEIDEIELQRIFMPDFRICPLSISKISILLGITLPSDIRICILCREICTTKIEMNQHYINHKLLSKVKRIKSYYICECGQEFPNNILLRQHKLQETKAKMREMIENYSIEEYNSAKNKRVLMSEENEENPKRPKNDSISENFNDDGLTSRKGTPEVKVDGTEDQKSDEISNDSEKDKDILFIEQNSKLVSNEIDQETLSRLIENSSSEGIPVSLDNLQDEEGYILYIVQ